MKQFEEKVRRIDGVCDADETYFAGANTAGGFVSFYPEIFDERSLARLYVIKGGPGSGKSSLMRRLISRAKKAGLSTGAYLCGSDPDSLDAAIIGGEGGKVAVIDATSPHAYDPRYPGAAAHLFDCGAYWNESELCARRESVVALADAKSAAYRSAYRYLAALGGVRRDLRRLGEEALDFAKMRAACRRFALGLHLRGGDKEGGASGAPDVRRAASCISMRSAGEIDFAPDLSTVTVTDSAYTAPAMMSTMCEELRALGIEVVRIVDCVEPDVICGLILPSRKIRVIRTDAPIDGAEKNFNMTRFLRRSVLALSRNKRSLARKCADSLVDGALSAFADAGEAHFALEDIYVGAMDFDALTEAADKMIAEAISIAAGR